MLPPTIQQTFFQLREDRDPFHGTTSQFKFRAIALSSSVVGVVGGWLSSPWPFRKHLLLLCDGVGRQSTVRLWSRVEAFQNQAQQRGLVVDMGWGGWHRLTNHSIGIESQIRVPLTINGWIGSIDFDFWSWLRERGEEELLLVAPSTYTATQYHLAAAFNKSSSLNYVVICKCPFLLFCFVCLRKWA